MRQTAARLNRAWLTVIGILMLLGGLVIIAIGTGLWALGGRQLGLDLSRPGADSKLFGSATASAFGLAWVIVLALVAGLVLGLLGLAWLVAQVPQINAAKPLRLHDGVETGTTRCEASVLTDAVESEIKSLPGVQDASAVLRGTAGEPDLTVKVTAGDRSDLPRLLAALQNQVVADLGASLDTQVRRLGVQVEIDTTKARTDKITV